MSLPLARLRGDVPVLGPVGIAVTTLTTVASQVLASDIVRHGILFHNPGATIKRILPVGATLVGGSGGIEIFPQSDFLLLGAQDDELYNVNCAWQAVTDNNADGSLSIWNFTEASSTTPPMMLSSLNTSIQSPSPTPTNALTGGSSTKVIGANPVRRGILFHNPTAVTQAVCPSNIAAAIGAGSRVILPGAQLTILAKGLVRCNCAFNAIAATGSNNPLTILEFV